MDIIKIERYDPSIHDDYRDKEDYYNSNMRPPEECDTASGAAWEIKEYLEYNRGSIELAFEYAFIIMGKYILTEAAKFISPDEIESLRGLLNKFTVEQIKDLY